MTEETDGPAPEFAVAPAAQGAFGFTGTWREYLPIAATNLLLTIVTLGIYRFWATTRTRRYLWSRTRFADDKLEWTGTGLEMFIGFLIVMVFLLPFLLFFQFGFQALVIRGRPGLAGVVLAAFYLGFFYLAGLAVFRALRYRLSRTYWHGIRGGSDDGGWSYGWSALWKTLAGGLALGMLIPWSMCQLWNDRWNKMSFGPHRFGAGATQKGLMGRWLLIYAVFIGGAIAIGVLIAGAVASGRFGPQDPRSLLVAAVPIVGLYLLILIAGVAYYARFFRQAIGATMLGPVQFGFNARSKDWYKLILGTIGLVLVTLGLGLVFVSYRNWSFFVRHLEAYGDIDLDTMTQSTTRGATDAEGLASAFDIGAI